MTAMLDSIRRLEAARNRGELTPDEFERAKERLFETVEDAVAEPVQARPRVTPTVGRPAPQNNASSDRIFWPALIASVLGVGIVTGLATLILGDLTLALTIAVTLLAAIMVKAFRALDE